jgi:hypothetical protein
MRWGAEEKRRHDPDFWTDARIVLRDNQKAAPLIVAL